MPDIPCPDCGGGSRTCTSCGGRGHWVIRSCPYKLIAPETWELIDIAGFARNGHLPEPGALRDQKQRDKCIIHTVWAKLDEAITDGRSTS